MLQYTRVSFAIQSSLAVVTQTIHTVGKFNHRQGIFLVREQILILSTDEPVGESIFLCEKRPEQQTDVHFAGSCAGKEVTILRYFDIPILHMFLSPELHQWKGARKHLLNGLQAELDESAQAADIGGLR